MLDADDGLGVNGQVQGLQQTVVLLLRESDHVRLRAGARCRRAFARGSLGTETMRTVTTSVSNADCFCAAWTKWIEHAFNIARKVGGFMLQRSFAVEMWMGKEFIS